MNVFTGQLHVYIFWYLVGERFVLKIKMFYNFIFVLYIGGYDNHQIPEIFYLIYISPDF